MGRYIDPNQPYNEVDKEYLRSRGRGHEIIENERRFGKDGASVPDELESAGQNPESASFDPELRKGLYDVGGAALPGTILDTDTGRVIPLSDRSEAPSNSFDYIDPETGEVIEDPDHFDDDIIEDVEAIKNIDELKKRLDNERVDHSDITKRKDLEDALIIALQDKRNAEKRGSVQQSEDDQFVDPALGDSFQIQDSSE